MNKSHGLRHVVKNPACEHHIERVLIYREELPEVTANEPDSLKAEDFLRDQAPEERMGVAFESEHRLGSRLLQHIGVPSLQWSELEYRFAVHTSQLIYCPSRSRVLKQWDGASLKEVPRCRKSGRPLTLEDIESVLMTGGRDYVGIEDCCHVSKSGTLPFSGMKLVSINRGLNFVPAQAIMLSFPFESHRIRYLNHEPGLCAAQKSPNVQHFPCHDTSGLACGSAMNLTWPPVFIENHI